MTVAVPASPPRPLAAVIGGWALFIGVETTTQVTLKFAGRGFDAADGAQAMLYHALTTPVVWLGFCLYFVGFLIWLTILKDLDLGRAFPMTAMVYLSALCAAVLLFHERLNPLRILAVLTIIAGVVLLASDENSDKRGSPVHG